MQILELANPHAMKSGTAFMDKITEMIREHKFMTIIETGCFMGDGTTKAIDKGLTHNERVYSIECNPGHIAVASRKYTQIEFLLGHSVPKSMLPVTISEGLPDHIFIDHLDKDRVKKYTQEVNFNVPDEMLKTALIYCNFAPDFVILDSAGYMGFAEFKYLMSLIPDHNFYLALDDTNHHKHYTTIEYIKERPDKFEIIWTTDEMAGSAIVRVL